MPYENKESNQPKKNGEAFSYKALNFRIKNACSRGVSDIQLIDGKELNLSSTSLKDLRTA